MNLKNLPHTNVSVFFNSDLLDSHSAPWDCGKIPPYRSQKTDRKGETVKTIKLFIQSLTGF